MLGVDLETGRARYDIEKINFTNLEDRRRYVPDAASTAVAWCPGIWARNWQNDAFSPRTGLLYTSTSNRCGAMRVVEGEFVPGEAATTSARAGARRSPRPGAITWTSCRPTIRSPDAPSGAWSGRRATTRR